MTVFAFIAFTEQVFFVIRIIAAIGGVVVGHFLSGPLLRVLWWFVFRRSIPPRLLPWAKSATGLGLGALLYFFVPLGGTGGWGFGGAGGGGSGSGSGNGTGGGPSVDAKSIKPPVVAKDSANIATNAVTATRAVIVVELIGGERYLGDGKYYLLDRKDPPIAISQVEETLKKSPAKTELHIVFTGDGVGPRHVAAVRLRELAQKLGIPMLDKVE